MGNKTHAKKREGMGGEPPNKSEKLRAKPLRAGGWEERDKLEMLYIVADQPVCYTVKLTTKDNN